MHQRSASPKRCDLPHCSNHERVQGAGDAELVATRGLLGQPLLEGCCTDVPVCGAQAELVANLSSNLLWGVDFRVISEVNGALGLVAAVLGGVVVAALIPHVEAEGQLPVFYAPAELQSQIETPLSTDRHVHLQGSSLLVLRQLYGFSFTCT